MNQQGGEEYQRIMERKAKPPPPPPPSQQQPLKCPRCESTNTKFCYYNNYNLSQPRYFCKNCKRYWTQGGILRNVPIGGGCRKGKRSSSKKAPSSSSEINTPNIPNFLTTTSALPSKSISSSSSLTPPIYYPSGGFVSSTLQPFNQHVGNIGNDFGGSSTFGQLQGFSLPSFSTPQQQHQYGMVDNGSLQPYRSSTSSQDWFINAPDPSNQPQSLYWSSNNNNNNNNVVSTSGGNSGGVGGGLGSSLNNPNQRRTSDQLDGFGLPPIASSSPSLIM
ncbi:hypothetical protein GIB67_037889 [Kingdonia uniflora]|uniref:Dof zinc finger protein n=1 Tax=Kingdonia uniflora TaxID=39325 RepID=A0A7J7LGW6_9MAGN|nr:hypothetical protein GIB67_037889 [Kingdonia uniflora]